MKLKIPGSNLESRRKQISLVEQEFRLLQKIHHPNLVPLYGFKWDALEDEECFHLYVAEQYVPGLSLNFYINVSEINLLYLVCIQHLNVPITNFDLREGLA